MLSCSTSNAPCETSPDAAWVASPARIPSHSRDDASHTCAKHPTWSPRRPTASASYSTPARKVVSSSLTANFYSCGANCPWTCPRKPYSTANSSMRTVSTSTTRSTPSATTASTSLNYRYKTVFAPYINSFDVCTQKNVLRIKMKSMYALKDVSHVLTNVIPSLPTSPTDSYSHHALTPTNPRNPSSNGNPHSLIV